MASTERNRSRSRRRWLRGSAGVALALPWLETFADEARKTAPPAPAENATTDTAAGGVKPPVRLGVLFFPNGVWQDSWIPKKAGADFELPFSLTPLELVRKNVLVLSGLDKAKSRTGDGHYAKTANFLTGLHVMKTTGKEIDVGGASLDQAAAAVVGRYTPLPSLELGCDPVISGIDSNVGYTRLYGSYISWQGSDRPVAREINPRLVYERLFGVREAKGVSAPRTDAARKLADDQSLLDLALEDAKSVRRQLGRDDQFKLDEYLDAVRAVERRIAFAASKKPGGWTPPTAPTLPPPPSDRPPADYAAHVQLMLDLMLLAFWTDSTRIATFMFANDVSGRNFGFVDGVHGSHHELSHHENKPEKIEQYQRIVRWHVAQYADLLRRMRDVKEGEGTLLDHSMMLLGCGMSDGNRHDPNNLPILLGGGGGKEGWTGGQHVASPSNTPLCNLYVSLLHRLGLPTKTFGDAVGPLAGLT
ncbi:MAG: DUF1552 domain-containing protein [Planctomycetia bacterium]